MSRKTVRLIVNGVAIPAAPGTTVAAALIGAQRFAFRSAHDGGARGPLCGMGVCYECRVTIDGVAHQRACMTIVRDGMRIESVEVDR